MKIALTSTPELVPAPKISRGMARVWVGETERGIKIRAYVCTIQVEASEDLSQFEAELMELDQPAGPKPGTIGALLPSRMF